MDTFRTISAVTVCGAAALHLLTQDLDTATVVIIAALAFMVLVSDYALAAAHETMDRATEALNQGAELGHRMTVALQIYVRKYGRLTQQDYNEELDRRLKEINQ